MTAPAGRPGPEPLLAPAEVARMRELLASDTPSPSAYCPGCRYLRTSPSHKLTCGSAS